MNWFNTTISVNGSVTKAAYCQVKNMPENAVRLSTVLFAIPGDVAPGSKQTVFLGPAKLFSAKVKSRMLSRATFPMYLSILLILLNSRIFGQEAACDSSCSLSCTTKEIHITGKAGTIDNYAGFLPSIEERLRELQGTGTISRGRFTQEPVIRGFGEGAISTSIDGMKIHGACVDKMDPAAGYVETENLKAIVIAADAVEGNYSTGSIGSINLVTEKPSFDDAFSFRTNNLYLMNGNALKSGTVLNLSNSSIAFRGSFTRRQSDNYTTGGSREIANSGYQKNNLKTDIMVKLRNNLTMLASFTSDYAADAGFPALIMDMRRARAELFNFEIQGSGWYLFETPALLKIYRNVVSHDMDDNRRSDAEVAAREAMPGMRMPMSGTYTTSGAKFDITLPFVESVYLLSGEYVYSRSFADMRMLSLTTGVPPMYLLNVGDAAENSYAVFGSGITPIGPVSLRMTARIEYALRNLNNTDAKAALQANERAFSPGRNYLLPAFSVEALYNAGKNKRISFSLAYSSRAPLFTESYGYYLFNPVENAFQIGNSNLRKEESLRGSTSYQITSERFFYTGKLFCDYLSDYIATELYPAMQAVGNVPFRKYFNEGNALVAGLELDLKYSSGSNSAGIKLSGQFSHSEKYNEPLPFTPPAGGSLYYGMTMDRLFLKLSTDWTVTQKTFAKQLAREQAQPGSVTWHIEGNYLLQEQLEIYLSVHNIFDQAYYTRFTVNKLQEPGRDIRIGFRYNYSVPTRED